ncbi:MAG: hypothetical protein IT327_02650 [Anaerolineae bacterium]|jgi:hypothetical protein|nr:hypothetical protein [Anaerolineae bacterium]
MNDTTLNYLGAALIVAFAIYIMVRSRAKGIRGAISEIGGRYIVFYAALTFMVTIVPRTIVNTSGNMGDWNQVTTGLGGAKEEASQFWQEYGLPASGRDGDGIPLDTSLLPTPVLPPETVAAIEVTPTPQVEGGEAAPTAPSQPESTGTAVAQAPEPTTTPTPQSTRLARIEELYELLVTAKVNGDRPGGSMIVSELEQLSPGDIIAETARGELEVAEYLIGLRNNLTARITSSLQPTQQGRDLVYTALGGGQFAIIDDGAKTFNSMCGETAQVRDITQGWTFGDTFEVPRCYLSIYGATMTGDTFTAPGGR